MPTDEQQVAPRAVTYNNVYDRLAGDGDLVGMIAYSIYKKDKKEWIIEQTPSPEAIKSYYGVITNTKLDLYKSNAEAKLLAYAQEIINSNKDEWINAGKDAGLVSEVKRQNSFFWNATASVIGSIVFAVLLYAFGIVFVSPSIQNWIPSASISPPSSTQTK